LKRQGFAGRLKRQNFFVVPALAFVTVVTLAPMVYNVYISMTNWNLIYGNQATAFVGLANYISAFESPAFRTAIGLTLAYAVCVTGIEIGLGIGIALMLNRDNPLAAFIRISLILPLMMTPYLVYLNWLYLTAPTVGPLQYMVGSLTGVYNFVFFDQVPTVYFSFLMIDIWQWLPFVVVICLAGMRSLAKAPFEAAQIDGAGGWAKFRYIMFPALRPILAIVVLFRFMDTFNSFGNVKAFTGGGPGEATYFISWLIDRTGLGTGAAVGLAAAYSIIYLILVLVIAWSLMYVIHRSGR